MKVKVIKKFRDKETRKIHQVGEELTLTKERFKEIESVGKFVEAVKSDDKSNESNKDMASE